MIALVAVALGASSSVRAEELRLGGTGGSLPAMRILGDAFSKANPGISLKIVPSLGSTGGIEALLDGAVQLAVSSRGLKDAEKGRGAVEVEYGRGLFVFVTSSKSVAGVTLQQVADIYSGKLDRWPDGKRIRLVLRPLGDSDTEMITRISPQMSRARTQAESRQGILFAVNDQENADYLEKLPGSFGASTVPQLISEKRSLKMLRLDGVQPSARAVARGSYPYYKRLYIVTGPQSPAAAHRFIAFVRSPAGRRILRRTGHWVVD